MACRRVVYSAAKGGGAMPRFCGGCGAELRGTLCSECGASLDSRVKHTVHHSEAAALSAARDADGRMRFRIGAAIAGIGVVLLGIIIVLANQSSPPKSVVTV